MIYNVQETTFGHKKTHKKHSFVALLLLLVEKLRIFAASLNNRTTY